MRILVLGSGGMLGHEIVEAFGDQEVIAADQPEFDLTRFEDLTKRIKSFSPDVIINCAAYTDVEGAQDNKDLAFRVNAEGVKNLALIADSLGAILIHFSTEYVFDGSKTEGYDEDDPTNSLNVYGQSKEQGENYLKNLCQKYYLIRSSWLYGGWPQKGKPRGKNFVDRMIDLASDQTEIKIVADQFGKPTYTKDLAQAVKKLLIAGRPFGIYHLVNENPASWFDLAAETLKLKGIGIKLTPITSQAYPAKAKRPANAILNNNKTEKLRTWQEALKNYLADKKI